MRTIQVTAVRDAVRDMCIEANYSLSRDMCSCLLYTSRCV